MDPDDAARHVLAAADALARAASRPVRGGKKETFNKSIPGDDTAGAAAADAMEALERLAVAAGERLARVARAMEGEGEV